MARYRRRREQSQPEHPRSAPNPGIGGQRRCTHRDRSSARLPADLTGGRGCLCRDASSLRPDVDRRRIRDGASSSLAPLRRCRHRCRRPRFGSRRGLAADPSSASDLGRAFDRGVAPEVTRRRGTGRLPGPPARRCDHHAPWIRTKLDRAAHSGGARLRRPVTRSGGRRSRACRWTRSWTAGSRGWEIAFE